MPLYTLVSLRKESAILSSMKRIPVAGPWITDREVAYVADAAGGDWYENAGRYLKRFETLFAEKTGSRYAIALPHCTSAIHLSLAALGIGPGDEVIVPEITWIATSAPIQYVGASPVFVDVEADTWCMSVESVRRALTPRTKAVIAVDLYGGMPDYGALRALCEEWGITLIEDAAQAAGATLDGKPAGSFGKAGVFSFHGSKTLTTGEGGMLVTSDDTLHERVLFLRDHGRPPGDKLFRNAEVAFKYRMSSVQAAMGLAQTERLDDLTQKKRQIFAWYAERLGDMPGLSLNFQPERVKNSYWMVTAVLDPALGLNKSELKTLLEQRQIETRPFFNPLSSLEAYSGTVAAERAAESNPVAYALSPYGINLPSALCLTEADVDTVCGHLRTIAGAPPRSQNQADLQK